MASEVFAAKESSSKALNATGKSTRSLSREELISRLSKSSYEELQESIKIMASAKMPPEGMADLIKLYSEVALKKKQNEK